MVHAKSFDSLIVWKMIRSSPFYQNISNVTYSMRRIKKTFEKKSCDRRPDWLRRQPMRLKSTFQNLNNPVQKDPQPVLLRF